MYPSTPYSLIHASFLLVLRLLINLALVSLNSLEKRLYSDVFKAFPFSYLLPKSGL